MISIQHVCLPSVLAYAAATTLPPSPVESPSRCDTPSARAVAVDPPKPPVISPVISISAGQRPVDPVSTVELPTVEPGSDQTLDTQTSTEESDLPSKEEARDSELEKEATTKPSSPAPVTSRVSFPQFAIQHKLTQHQNTQKCNLLRQLRDVRVSICLSARLLRIGAICQKGLVESFKHGDKSSFVSIYNTVHEIRDSLESGFRPQAQPFDPFIGSPSTPELDRDQSCSFVRQLTPRSRDDLMDILMLLRTDPQFLFERIGNLLPSQLSALVSPVHSLHVNDSPFPLASRGRTQPLLSKRVTSNSLAYREHALAFERSDSLSSLIFNVFAASLDSNSPEARLRLDVWSSTCAKLVSYGGSGHYSFVGHLLLIWSASGEWKAKQKFGTYLMDVLQKGAFLLEHLDSPRRLGFDGDAPDPLRTDVAEQFFQSAVRSLFEVLDDSDAGLPRRALEFSNAILRKLGMTESRKRALEYIFFQWFFCQFLHNAISYPEAHGLLLDFHISKDARERLLGQIALRAQSQVSRVLHSLPQFSLADPEIRAHVESMLSRFNSPMDSPDTPVNPPTPAGSSIPDQFLLLSSSDIVTILDVLFPRPASVLNSAEAFRHQSIPSSPSNPMFPDSTRPSRPFEPSFFQGRIDTFSSQSSSAKTVFTTEMSFQDATRSYTASSLSSKSASPPSPENSLARSADRIRYELSVINESEDRPMMGHISKEDWALISISEDGKNLTLESSAEERQTRERTPYEMPKNGKPTPFQTEDSIGTLQAAVVRLVDELDSMQGFTSYDLMFPPRPTQAVQDTLKQRFTNAMGSCQHATDFVGAHYWWNASRLLRETFPFTPAPDVDAKLLFPMYMDAKGSLEISRNIIEGSESSLVSLKQMLGRLQGMVRELMSGLAKFRNKMWYMTDVKNSLRYEDAKNVALALRTMAGPQALQPHPEPRTRPGSRTLGSSFLQKPEVQVMNVMKAPGNQGGPYKLADEQVEITRKWLDRSGIDNFCKGEERIHRFCYEVKSSVNRLVGETMYDTPVLWSSELYHKERVLYESSNGRPMTGLSNSTVNVRPSSIASEDSLYHSSQTFSTRSFDHLLRPLNEAPSLAHKSSFQSFASDRWRTNREVGGGDTSSIGDSPGRTISTSTADSIHTFWSPIQTQAQSTTSASSFYSRPPSMFSDMMPRRVDRNTHGKSTFLNELKQTLTSLLLSDLGSPVWSCGSETDAWFSDYLNQPRIKAQMEKQARLDRFLASCPGLSERGRDYNENRGNTTHKLRRCKSVDSSVLRARREQDNQKGCHQGQQGRNIQMADSSGFKYEAAFSQLMEKFTRQANPFVKLTALHELRSLIIASLSSSAGSSSYGPFEQAPSTHPEKARRLSEGMNLQYAHESSHPSSPVLSESETAYLTNGSSCSPREDQIISAMRSLILSTQPKTLFRDLQFIAAFVPSEILNKTESGKAFLQFGLAAFALKDDVCNSMVEIADKIVSQELSRRQRHPPIVYDFGPQFGNGIKDAARMWIITAREGDPTAQRELAILYLTHPEILPWVTLPLTMPRDTFKAEMMYRRNRDSKSDPQIMCLALHWMQLSASGGDELARNRLREREEFESIA